MDWARLAQQWIMMKEVTDIPAAPPPPMMAMMEKQVVVEEGGEAPMDIGKDEEAEPEPAITQQPAGESSEVENLVVKI